MQNCLDKLNLMYCLIYLDDMIAFSKTQEEHVWCLCVVFKCFQEHNLKLKMSKCEFFHNEINYLAHRVSKEGKVIIGDLTRDLSMWHKPLHEHLSEEGAGKKNEWVTLTSDAQIAFEMLRKACLEAPVLAFANFDKPFLLETDTSKLGLGEVLLQKQPDVWYHPVAYDKPVSDQPWA